MTRKTRTDAERNRRLIIDAARGAFAADGLDTPMREVARRAGVGVATLYRHFPTRPELVDEVLAERVALCVAEMQEALDDPDAWHGLCLIVHQFAWRQAGEKGLNEALLGSHSAGRAFGAQRAAQAEALGVLVDRASLAGSIRGGVTVDDVRIGLRAIASLRNLPAERADAATARLADLLLAGMAARPGELSRAPGANTAR